MKDLAIILLDELANSRDIRISDDWQEAQKMKFLGEYVIVVWPKNIMNEKQIKNAIKNMEKYWPEVKKMIGTFYDDAKKSVIQKLKKDELTDTKEGFESRMIPNHILFQNYGAFLVLGDFVIRQILKCDLEVSFNKDGNLIGKQINIAGSC